MCEVSRHCFSCPRTMQSSIHDEDELRVVRRESILDNRIVVLKVGSAPTKDFTVHEAILREHSHFFRSALDKRWREGRSRIVELPDDDAEVVSAYVDWLYFRKIASKPISPPELPMDDGEYQLLAQLYVFGDKVQADAFCDSVLDAMAQKTDDVATDGTRTFPSHSAIMALYNGTPMGSPGRRFVVDMYAEYGAQSWIPSESEFNHAEFLTDLVRALLDKRQTSSVHKQSNFPRRRKWHKNTDAAEFLQPATSRE
ncbi:hypothetical protein CLAFUW4_11456 [Fulvia fulva]|uniref:BTB domain-containing protein n=1 Tax=Passalora fulva TaxID=5499 RepID=A0A9Q8PCT9_PASFU|nr:uncharacterized protein CLAFUR5_10499 [Fulvia fulva]KAK4619511.1 hypothetical protein CLAFUR4_11462 [Fulvia fulva]KAK4620901.1 hypothetical protein CLAFUR0_11470 [Fulvia fulva]UJO20118.1 hypothetical protein CLAFUR5_10499 [Fulvia fulva]WPV17692.1 hypothetical protein CLAFUW4_11456 [Fulvia fulva]WPV31889.1 hypothetical protein CLAFUW7_11461 [Fulvia fulva]